MKPILWFAVLIVSSAASLASCGGSGDGAEQDVPPPVELESRVVDVDGVAMTSHLVRITVRGDEAPVGTLDLHYVDNEVVSTQTPAVFLHGAPDCWYTWHAQMAALSAERRVIAIDLPGYGPHGDPYQPAGTYYAEFVAEQLLALLDALDVGKFDLVGHDWGSAIASFVAGRHPDRVRRFVRSQAPVSTYDPANTPWWDIMSDPVQGPAAVATLQVIDPVAPIPPEDVLPAEDRPAYEAECLTPERFEAWRRYFVDSPYEPMMAEMPLLAAATALPVLLLQADSDSGQPLDYFADVEEIYPDAELRVVVDSGHFSQIEQSDQVTQAIREFLLAP